MVWEKVREWFLLYFQMIIMGLIENLLLDMTTAYVTAMINSTHSIAVGGASGAY